MLVEIKLLILYFMEINCREFNIKVEEKLSLV